MLPRYPYLFGLIVAAIMIGQFWTLVEPKQPTQVRIFPIYAGSDHCVVTRLALNAYVESSETGSQIFVYPYQGAFTDRDGNLWLPPAERLARRDRLDQLPNLDHCLGPVVDQAVRLNFLSAGLVEDLAWQDTVLSEAEYPPDRMCLIFRSIALSPRSRHASVEVQDLCRSTEFQFKTLYFEYARNGWMLLSA